MEDPGIVAGLQGSSELDQGLRRNLHKPRAHQHWGSGQSRQADGFLKQKTLRVSLAWRKFYKIH